MIENFDKWWGVAVTVGGIVAMLITTLLTATSDLDDDPTNDPKWQKVLRGIALVVSRVFSVSTFKNQGAKRGFELKLPVVQSSAPSKLPIVQSSAPKQP